MGFCVITATTPRNDASMHIGEWANDAPGIQFIFGSQAVSRCFGL